GSIFGQMRAARARRRSAERGRDRTLRITLDFLEAVRGGVQRISLADGRTLNVQVPAGIEDGKQIRLKGQGEPGTNGGAAGDALIEVSVRAHPWFSRK